jgi:hypothetical protein
MTRKTKTRKEKAAKRRAERREKEEEEKSTYESIKEDLHTIIEKVQVIVKYIVPPALLIFSTVPGIVHALGFTPTDLPANYETLLNYGVYWTYAVWVSLVPTLILRDWIARQNKIQLLQYDPDSSETAWWEFSSDLWDDVEAYSEDGEPVDLDDLDQIHTKRGVGYSTNDFDADQLELLATPLAMSSNLDIRLKKGEISRIQEYTHLLTEEAINVLSQRSDIAREAALREILTRIHRNEDVNLDSETELTALENLFDFDEIDEEEIIKQAKQIQDSQAGDSDE